MTGEGTLKILLTGRPGIGKTTALLKIIEECKKMGLKIGGMVTKEVREGPSRTGFELIDIATGKKGILASIYILEGPRVGKYRVDLRSLSELGSMSIKNAVLHADIVFIDEIGPMELFSREFQEAVLYAFESRKPLVGTVHRKAKNFKFTRFILDKYKPQIIELSYENRNKVPLLVVNYIKTLFKK
ncbi:MAG: hypothetical protein DRJ47_02135 [Thermoprotei archaeon]|nr:MAG: hypothetical protein DRJ47_02135 [Thermoprotei archaeon]